ncbi:MAG: hypothetical protein D6735_05730 [Acidobacteria bacterium]|jgi:hypothetical protein|nr:MAG: hypothetical protein D6735_05730 [Acidobacteriota bacterium]
MILQSTDRSVILIISGLSLVTVLLASFLSPVIVLMGIGLVLGFLLTLHLAFSLNLFVWLFLLTRPLIDLTWRWHFFTVLEEDIDMQTLFGLMGIAVICFAYLFRRIKLVLDLKIMLFLVFASFSVILTPSSFAFNELMRLYVGVAFFFVTGLCINKESSFDRFVWWFILVISIPVILSFLQKAGILPFEYWDWIDGRSVGRVSGTYQHPLNLVYFLVFAIPFSFYLLSKRSITLYARLFLWFFIGLSCTALLFTFHRAGIVAIGLEIWLWMIFTKQYGKAMLLTIAAVLIIFALLDYFQKLYDNLALVFSGSIALSSGEFLRGRGMNWYLFTSSLFSSDPWFWFFGKGDRWLKDMCLTSGIGHPTNRTTISYVFCMLMGLSG